MAPVRFVVWYDYLCPWCYNGAVRLGRLRRELAGRVELEWRAYLLRPVLRPPRDVAAFREYTRSWTRPAAEPDAGRFRVWAGEGGPPTHSVPPHRVAKAAAALGPGAFDAVHARLLRAYFAESRDVTDPDVLAEVWDEAGLPADAFERAWELDALAAVLADHAAAREAGVTGVPAVQRAGDDPVIVGAQPLELYRRWAQRALDGRI